MPAASPPELVQAFRRRFGREPAVLARAPGRVDLLGAHVDYNEGHVLAMAVDRHVWVAADRAAGPRLSTVVALDLQSEARLAHDRLEHRTDVDGTVLAPWARYPAGVAWALSGELPGLDAVVTGNVPRGAGVSSSAALEVAFATAWLALAERTLPPMEVAQACRRAENEYVGVACGLMDQFCAVFGRAGRALLLDCRTLEWQALPMPRGTALVLADTLTRRQLTDGALNDRQRECQMALSTLAARLPGVRALRDVAPEALEAHAPWVPEPARSRARHIVAEEARVLAGAEALRAGDAPWLGRLMLESHASARELYAASGEALEAMWAAGRSHDACLGGRFIGAGFAGCLLFLAVRGGARALAAHAGRRYAAVTGRRSSIAQVRPADGCAVSFCRQDARC